eukprot:m.357739 g.357739  ORF g.357739 m.357739 type:complete len:411 (-) comp17923_c0_seq1:1857-3089(-)
MLAGLIRRLATTGSGTVSRGVALVAGVRGTLSLTSTPWTQPLVISVPLARHVSCGRQPIFKASWHLSSRFAQPCGRHLLTSSTRSTRWATIETLFQRFASTSTRKRANRPTLNLASPLWAPYQDVPFVGRPWYKKGVYIILVSLFVYLLTRFEEVPGTGRIRCLPLPNGITDMIIELSAALTAQGMSTLPENLSDDTPEYQFVFKIVAKLCESAGIDVDTMMIRVINDEAEVNAACMGNLIFVYTGLLNLLEWNEARVAFVLGHELGHSIARHNAETIGFVFLEMLLEQLISFKMKMFVSLPMSREMEYEADALGLELQARSCYRLTGAHEALERIRLFEEAMGSDTVEFLSTHPNTERRVERLLPGSPLMEKASESYSIVCQDEEVELESFNALQWLGALAGLTNKRSQ